MAKYTTEVRSICETYAGMQGTGMGKNVSAYIEGAIPKIFDFDFPIFDEAYRLPLEKKILMHFYFREIGFETVGLWKTYLNMKLNECMPYYNELYKTQVLDFNPLYDTDLWTTYTKTGKEDKTEKETTTGTKDITETEAGTTKVTRDGTESGSRDVSRTDSETVKDTLDGNLTTSGTDSGTKDSTLKEDHATTDSGSSTKWSYFHDTPQGNITSFNNGDYLTSAQRDVTNDNRQGTDIHNLTGKDVYEDSSAGTEKRDDVRDIVRSGSGRDEESTSRTTSGNEDGSSKKDRSVSESQDVAVDVAGQINSLEDYTQHVAGKSPGVSFAKMIKEFRDSLLNLDMLVIGELEELFMGLW